MKIRDVPDYSLKKLENGKYLLDFNLAYNPACAFSDYYSWPIPPISDTLQVPIRAGEMDSHYRSRSDELHTRPLNGLIRWASVSDLFAGKGLAFATPPVFRP